MHDAQPCPPIAVAVDLIGEACRRAFMPEVQPSMKRSFTRFCIKDSSNLGCCRGEIGGNLAMKTS